MRITNEEKIAKINSDRKVILENIQEKLKNSNEICNDNLGQIASLLKTEDESQKEYKAILKAKDLILELTKEIANSNSVEEIVSIRKKINYYINKIKKILNSRGIFENEINELSKKTNNLRKDVANYIRFLKREEKISQIEELTNKESLTDEEKNNLKKLFRNEMSYIRRTTNPVVKKEKTQEKLVINEEVEDNKNNLEEVVSKLSLDEIEEMNNNREYFYYPPLDMVLRYVVKPSLDNYKSLAIGIDGESYEVDFRLLEKASKQEDNDEIEFLEQDVEVIDEDEKIETINDNEEKVPEALYFNRFLTEEDIAKKYRGYKRQYHFRRLKKYNSNFIVNLSRLLSNVPKIIHNKKMIKNMKKDYNNFYRGEDLRRSINNALSENSIAKSLRLIFKNSLISKREEESLIAHSNVLNELYNFNILSTMEEANIQEYNNVINYILTRRSF